VCSQRCHNWRERHGDARPSWLDARKCEYCGRPIDSPDIRLRFCDEQCRRRKGVGSAMGLVRLCWYCDEAFTVKRHSRQIYCTPDCRARYNRQWGSATALRRQAERRGASRGERFTMLDLAMRDGWICGLCLGPIDWRIRGDHYLEPTVDHVMPITAGGEHSMANAQLGHWTCNAAKRNSTDVVMMSVPSRESKREIKRWPEGVQHPSPRAAESAPIRVRPPRA
jgi:5-methylcytosine-specific restriction endonuclease McrA